MLVEELIELLEQIKHGVDRMFIDLHRIYECNSCKAILDEEDIDVIKTDLLCTYRCPICGNESLVLIKLS